MIKFFRHIRKSLVEQNKMSKYFKYAIGEILLVVIGILIALQINNWNENRKRLQKERELYLNIIKDLDEEHKVLQEHITYSDTLKNYFRKIYERGSGKSDSLELANPFLLVQNFNYASIMLQNHENSTDKISSVKLRSSLNEYLVESKDLFTRRTEEVNAINELRRPFLIKNKVIDLNKLLYENTESNSINISALAQIKDAEDYDFFIAIGYASNQTLIFSTKYLIKKNRALKAEIENSELLAND